MPDVQAMAPFEAYRGPKSYIFVSYAHANGAQVFKDLAELNSKGYRIWYDEGIDPGNEWPEEVANALANACFVLVFVTLDAIKSRNVRNEIDYALSHDKAFLAVHLQETALPPGMELRMGNIQAVMKYRMTEENYWKKMAHALPEECVQHAIWKDIADCLGRIIEQHSVLSVESLNVFLSANGDGIVAQCHGKPVGYWKLPEDPSDLASTSEEIFSKARHADSWRPSDSFTVSIGAERPQLHGDWYEVTSPYGPRPYIDIKCRVCGCETDFTPAEREGPPEKCPRCGAG
jgi:hypothetical protein